MKGRCAGALRSAVEIQAKTQASDGQGGFTDTWAQVPRSPTRAAISAAPGSERWAFNRQVPGNGYKMTTRWFDSFTASQRVIWKTKEYAVLGVVDPDGREEWLEWRLSDGKAS